MIVVIVGGPAGRLGAMRLARAGREVTLVDRGGVGGQCLHHGCMVICALSDVARTLSYARTLTDLGVLDAVPRVSFPAMVAELRKIQAQIEAVLDDETRQAGVTVLTDHPRLLSAGAPGARLRERGALRRRAPRRRALAAPGGGRGLLARALLRGGGRGA